MTADRYPSLRQMVQRANDGHRKALAAVLGNTTAVGPTEPLSSIRGMRTCFATLRRWGCFDGDPDKLTDRGLALLQALNDKTIECPDGGRCWHYCGDACWRTKACAPLSRYGADWHQRPMSPVRASAS